MIYPEAIIFDLDGVLWHSSDVHARAFYQAFREEGLELPDDAYSLVAGMKTDAAVNKILNQFDPTHKWKSISIKKIIKRKKELALQWLVDGATLDENTDSTIVKLPELGYKIALATSASKSTMDCFLNKLSPVAKFDALVCGEFVLNGKPAPDIFILAAEYLGIKPTLCVVIEDSEAGIIAAIHAGMQVIPYRCSPTINNKLILPASQNLPQVVASLAIIR